MKISESWLRARINPPVDTQALADRLTMVGLEIEGIHPVAGDFTKVIVAEITKIIPHPDAERLRVCTVSTGSAMLNVVCGGKNIYEGMRAPLAMIGAMLPGNVNITESKLRGVLSQGMLCAATELGLATEGEGVVDLPADAPIGKDFREYLGLNDKVLEVSITPNRGDCLSVLGVARELSAIYQLPINFSWPPISAVIEDQVSIDLQAAADCGRYCSRVIKKINNKIKSPLWLQEQLRRSGIRSISPAVDVTNIVMLELGQPMHVFDFDKIDSGLVVRLAHPAEKIKLLDESEVTLHSQTMVIADHKKALAIAGVMGGLDSGVSEFSENIVLEAAFFSPLAIAKTAKTYGLKSESSYRFERGVDPMLAAKAIERATKLLQEIVGGEPGPVVQQSIEDKLPISPTIVLRHARLQALLGLSIEAPRVEAILKSLNMHISVIDKGWSVVPPTYRFDMAIEEDLIEEVARIYGYDHMPRTPALYGSLLQMTDPRQSLRRRAKSLLCDHGYHEVISYSFVDEKLQSLLGLSAGQVPLVNPISTELGVMRTSLLPGLLVSLAHNVKRQQTRVRLFESGLCFEQVGHGLSQEPFIAGLLMGSRFPEQWGVPSQSVDFFDAKGECENLLALLDDSSTFDYRSSAHASLHPGQSADIIHNNETIGFVGAVHPNVLKDLDISGPVFVFQCQLTKFVQHKPFDYIPVSKFPAIRRDLAFIMKEDVLASDVIDTIRKAGGDLVCEVTLFDVYAGKGVPEGHKSLAFGLVLQQADRTLVDEEVSVIMSAVVGVVKQAFGATLRE